MNDSILPPNMAVFLVQCFCSTIQIGDRMICTLIAWMVTIRKSMISSPDVLIATNAAWFYGRQDRLAESNRYVVFDSDPQVKMQRMLTGVFSHWRVLEIPEPGSLIPRSSGVLVECTNERGFLIKSLVQLQTYEYAGLFDLYVKAYPDAGYAYLGSFPSRNKAQDYLEAKIDALGMSENYWWSSNRTWYVID